MRKLEKPIPFKSALGSGEATHESLNIFIDMTGDKPQLTVRRGLAVETDNGLAVVPNSEATVNMSPDDLASISLDTFVDQVMSVTNDILERTDAERRKSNDERKARLQAELDRIKSELAATEK